jgi:ferredoxin-like protein FixX
MKIDDKLALNLFHVDEKPHITIDQEKCRKCPHKACTRVCPVENYTIEGDEVRAEFLRMNFNRVGCGNV